MGPTKIKCLRASTRRDLPSDAADLRPRGSPQRIPWGVPPGRSPRGTRGCAWAVREPCMGCGWAPGDPPGSPGDPPGTSGDPPGIPGAPQVPTNQPTNTHSRTITQGPAVREAINNNFMCEPSPRSPTSLPLYAFAWRGSVTSPWGKVWKIPINYTGIPQGPRGIP